MDLYRTAHASSAASPWTTTLDISRDRLDVDRSPTAAIKSRSKLKTKAKLRLQPEVKAGCNSDLEAGPNIEWNERQRLALELCVNESEGKHLRVACEERNLDVQGDMRSLMDRLVADDTKRRYQKNRLARETRRVYRKRLWELRKVCNSRTQELSAGFLAKLTTRPRAWKSRRPIKHTRVSSLKMLGRYKS
jgi:hypothetical protein